MPRPYPHADRLDQAKALRLLETASPPTFYLPVHDVRVDLLRPASGVSHCEWKVKAAYWSVQQLACLVDGERVQPQPGRFYAGWITPELVGPFKGEPGSGGW